MLEPSRQRPPQLIKLGRIDSETLGDGEFTLEPSWLTRGTVIVGKSGTGKSHDIALIAKQLGRLGFATMILDRTGEHAEALAQSPHARILRPGNDLTFRLLSPTDPSVGETPEAIEDVLDTMAHFFAVSYGEKPTPLQQRIVRENLETRLSSLVKGQGPDIGEFISMVRRYQEFKKGIHGFTESCESIVSRLYQLKLGRMGEVFNQSRQNFPIEELFKPGVHIVDLSPITFEPAKNLLSQIIVKRSYQAAKRMGRTTALRQLIIVDEAHHIAPNREDYRGQSFLDLIGIENRKYGQGLLLASTSPSQLSETLLRNASIRLCHMLDDGKDIDLMLRFMVNKLESDRFIADIRMLGLGEAVAQISAPVMRVPCKLKIAERFA